MADWQPLTGRAFVQAITGGADLYNLDRLALFANAIDTGIGGQISANGLGFGPWQMHLIDGRVARWDGRGPFDLEVQEWAWAIPGLRYAVTAFAGHGARGLRGHAAVRRMATYLEGGTPSATLLARRYSIYDHLRTIGDQLAAYVARIATGPSFAPALPDPTAAVVSADAASTVNAAWRNLLSVYEHTVLPQTHAVYAIARRLPHVVR